LQILSPLPKFIFIFIISQKINSKEKISLPFAVL